MSDKPGKYATALAAINQPAQTGSIDLLLPRKEPVKLHGKRSRAGWRQKSVLLNSATVERALERLRRRGDGTDFSDLTQLLIEAWLATPE